MASKLLAPPPRNAARCGYCMKEDQNRSDPRRLPCGHECCMQCLLDTKKDYNTQSRPLKCNDCVSELGDQMAKEIKSVTCLAKVDPKPAVKEPSVLWCDKCARKDDLKRASFYCTRCRRKLCGDHNKAHYEDVGWDHEILTAEDYEEHKRSLAKIENKIRSCDEHRPFKLTMGCSVCKETFCEVCRANIVQEDGPCDGKRHKYVPCESLEEATLSSMGGTVKDLKSIKKSLLGNVELDYEAQEKLRKTAVLLSKQLDAREEKQIKAIKDNYLAEKEKLSALLDKHTDALQTNSATMRDKIAEIDKILTEFDDEVPELHVADMIAKDKEAQQLLANMNKKPLRCIYLPEMRLEDQGVFRTCELSLTDGRSGAKVADIPRMKDDCGETQQSDSELSTAGDRVFSTAGDRVFSTAEALYSYLRATRASRDSQTANAAAKEEPTAASQRSIDTSPSVNPNAPRVIFAKRGTVRVQKKK